MKFSTILLLLCLSVSQLPLCAQSPAYPPPPSALQPINRIECFIDQDPGMGNGTPLTITNAIDIPNRTAIIPLSGVSNGIHHLFIRSQDGTGAWSLTAVATFENFHPSYPPPATAPAVLSQLEVFFDNDPGRGHGSIQSVPPGTDIGSQALTLNIDTLSKGAHRLFIRTLDIPSLSATAAFSNDAPLPLTWLYIKAEDINGQSQLSWATAQESNTQKFEIEQCTDGHSFTTIGTTPAAGNSNTVTTYKWIHTDPAPGINYYRIKQIDLDKNYTWSKVVTLFFGSGSGKTMVVPNPAIDRVTVLLATPAEQSTINLYNAAGQSIRKLALRDGSTQQEVQLSELPAGIYFLEVVYKTHKELLRVIKK